MYEDPQEDEGQLYGYDNSLASHYGSLFRPAYGDWDLRLAKEAAYVVLVRQHGEGGRDLRCPGL